MSFCVHTWMSYLNEATGRELPGFNDQFWAVPESQCITQEYDAPKVTLKHTNDRSLLNTPRLGLQEVPVIPVEITIKKIHSTVFYTLPVHD